MNFLCTDRHSRAGLIALVLMALVFSPFVSAGLSAPELQNMVSQTNSEHAQACSEMHKNGVQTSPQAGASDCCDQNTDCKTHCQNLVLTHLPVSAFVNAFSFQVDSSNSLSPSLPEILTGISTSLDPRPPCV